MKKHLSEHIERKGHRILICDSSGITICEVCFSALSVFGDLDQA